MKKLILENFRCLVARQEVPIKPLTLLVGENSTGKTSFLAAVRLANDLGMGRSNLDFNEEPFELGSFEQIAFHGAGRRKRASSFTIGYVGATLSRTPRKLAKDSTLLATFEKGTKGSQPALMELVLDCDPYCISTSMRTDKERPEQKRIFVRVKTPSGEFEGHSGSFVHRVEYRFLPPPEIIEVRRAAFLPAYRSFFGALIEAFFDMSSDSKRPKLKPGAPPEKELNAIMSLAYPEGLSARPLASPPIRSVPLPLYDLVREPFQRTGTHAVPILAELKATAPAEARKLMADLARFGRDCSLFQGIDVKPLGGKDAGTVRLTVKIAGRSMNFKDVGYGVSQVLPILVDALGGRKDQTYLLQQPEVHLHPRAIAELGTLFGLLAKRDKKTFIVETHSDFIVDRIRTEIRRKKKGFVRAKDVAILYFERENGEVRIHPITIDNDGNLVGVPPGYRQFFLDEERHLLGLE